MIETCGDRVTFHLQGAQAMKVYLVGHRPKEAARVVGMRQESPGCWRTDLELPPGEFRYCYYLYDGRTIQYHAPEGVAMDGLKAVVRVDAR